MMRCCQTAVITTLQIPPLVTNMSDTMARRQRHVTKISGNVVVLNSLLLLVLVLLASILRQATALIDFNVPDGKTIQKGPNKLKRLIVFSTTSLPSRYKQTESEAVTTIMIRGGASEEGTILQTPSKKTTKKRKKTSKIPKSGNDKSTTVQAKRSKKKKTVTRKNNSKPKETKLSDDFDHERDQRIVEEQDASRKKEVGGTRTKINNKLKDTADIADALGDAIRNRADEILPVKIDNDSHPSIESIGWAMGSSEQKNRLYRRRNQLLFDGINLDDNEDADDGNRNDEVDIIDDGEVSASPSSVVANYFLRSHGGAHAIQCFCSVLSVTAGLLSLLLSSSSTKAALFNTIVILQKRCLLFALVKHFSGLFSSCILAARSIPIIGFRKSRYWIASIVNDPISQYAFYCACVIVWLPQQQQQPADFVSIPTNPSTSVLSFHVPIWQRYRLINICLVGPVLIREIISTLFVVSDVLVLVSTTISSGQEINDTILLFLLKLSHGISDATMSLLVTPKKWKSLDTSSRQIVLAKLASKCSLLLEVAVGIVMSIDSIWSLVSLLFGSTGTLSSSLQKNQLTITNVVKRIVCTLLYVEFLSKRKMKISKLVLQIRGGTSQVPFRLLDIILNPLKEMGIVETTTSTNPNQSVMQPNQQHQIHDVDSKGATLSTDTASNTAIRTNVNWSWQDYIKIALGI